MLQEYFTFGRYLKRNFDISSELLKYPLGGLSSAADGKRAFNLVNKLNRSVK